MRFPTVVLMLALLPLSAAASTEEAWEEFRAQVRDACAALVQAPEGARVGIEVNPFGSESHGAALVTVGHETGEDRMICIFDKRAGTAELTAPFDPAGTR